MTHHIPNWCDCTTEYIPIPTFLTSMNKDLPPFFGETNLILHFRTFYFDKESSDDRTVNEAWAGGGWLKYESGTVRTRRGTRKATCGSGRASRMTGRRAWVISSV
jgi:hypothetical protein